MLKTPLNLTKRTQKNYYLAGVLNVLEGGSLDIRDKFSFNLHPIKSQKDWEKLLDTLWNNAEKFADIYRTYVR